MCGTLLGHPRWHPEPLGLLVAWCDIHWTLLCQHHCGWLWGRQTFHSEKTQSVKRAWLKQIYLVWSLPYQQCSNSLYDVRFVLTDGCISPGAMGGECACQAEVAIALSHGVLDSLAQRSPWDLERGSAFFQLGFPCAGLYLSVFLFSFFIYFFPPLPFPSFLLSSIPLSFLLPFFLVNPVYVI